MVIGFIGPSGSGKDTQAAMISKKYGIPTFSIGEVMRTMISEKHPLGLKAQGYMDNGEWVPDELVTDIMQQYIKDNVPEGFIVTGFPRKTVQYELLKERLAKIGLKYDLIIHFTVNDDEALRRMKMQAVESEKQGKLRADASSEELMLKRLKSYHDTITPVLRAVEKDGVLAQIDASPSKEEIFQALSKLLESRFDL